MATAYALVLTWDDPESQQIAHTLITQVSTGNGSFPPGVANQLKRILRTAQMKTMTLHSLPPNPGS
jgi:hypothetical protein